MTTIRTLEEAPKLIDFCNQVLQEEITSTTHEITAYDLKLYPRGMLGVSAKNLSRQLQLTDAAISDLARLVEIPATYFEECDSKLRSLSFNWRLRRKVPAKKPLQLVLRDDVVDRILNGNLLRALRSPILDTVSNAIPQNIEVRKEDLKVILYEWDGQFDISIIAPTLNCMLRKNDTVAFGVNVSEGSDGAIQIQGATLRLICSNGAINRVCDSQIHRIRRPINRTDRQHAFLRTIASLASECWAQYGEHAQALQGLMEISLNLEQMPALTSRLRQAPFFLSARIITRVLNRLRIEVALHGGNPCLYDLYNAMTFLGTHEQDISRTYRTRLRIGAGEFTRHQSRICGACRQLLLA